MIASTSVLPQHRQPPWICALLSVRHQALAQPRRRVGLSDGKFTFAQDDARELCRRELPESAFRMLTAVRWSESTVKLAAATYRCLNNAL